MAEYIKRETLDELMENRNVRGDCKFCAKYERCIKNGINRKGSHLYCWEKIKLPTADVVEVVRCKDCKHYWNYMGIDKMHYMKCTYDPVCDTPIHEMHFCSYGERKDT